MQIPLATGESFVKSPFVHCRRGQRQIVTVLGLSVAGQLSCHSGSDVLNHEMEGINLFADKTILADVVSSHLSQNWLNIFRTCLWLASKTRIFSCEVSWNFGLQWIWGTKRECAETESANYPVGWATTRGGQSLGAQRSSSEFGGQFLAAECVRYWRGLDVIPLKSH